MDWDNIRCFIEVAERKSFNAAAERLRVSVATVARRVTALENELKLTLVERGPVGITLTSHGSTIFGLSKPGSEYFYQIERVADSLVKKVQKQPIRISGIEPLITEVLTPELPALLEKDPNLLVELNVSLENSDPNKNQTDIGIALERPQTDSLVTRRIFEPDMGLFAAREYYDQHCSEPIDLTQLSILGYTKFYGDILETDWVDQMGLAENLVFRTNSTDALIQATKIGMGVSVLPVFLGNRYDFKQLHIEPKIPRRELWLVFNSELRSIRKLDLIKDWILETCEKTL